MHWSAHTLTLRLSEKLCVDVWMTKKTDHERQNIRIVSLLEEIEGSHPTTFIETFLVENFREDNFPRKLRLPQQNGPPQSMIARLHYYRTKEMILHLSWEQAGQLTHWGQKISFYPDISLGLVRRRVAFNPVNKQLQEARVKYSLSYPAKLRFTLNGSKHTFKSPRDASALIKANIKKTGETPGSDVMPTLMPALSGCRAQLDRLFAR